MGHLTFLSKHLSETKRFRNSLIQHVSVSCVDGSLHLSIPRGFFCCCPFRDCAIIIWRGVLRLIGGPELKPKRRVGGVRCHFLNICRGG